MSHVSSHRINDFVAIRKMPDHTFEVEYGPADPVLTRYRCDGFESLDAAIAWVDRLDRCMAVIVPAASLPARPKPAA